ncbi:ABC transporter ATP-binding protein [Brooklawnia sp.]|uniref:ABC transporter ATP-binding protein n=1 Tax=Brooklawnia sp. TaxID=2699740 RepID=UPI00311FED32
MSVVSAGASGPSGVLLTGELGAFELRKAFGDRLVLAGATLRVPASSSVAIMGVSGSGKSTLLHLLAGIDLPDAGRVLHSTVDGAVEVSALAAPQRTALRLRHLGLVFQRDLLLPELTAQENVALPCLLAGVAKRDALATADARLGELGLEGLGQQRPGRLSGGEAQRVAIVRAVAAGPRIVFADEPTAALDPETGAAVMRLLLAATTGRGRTLVVATHDHDVAAACDKVVELRDGVITERRAQG